MPEKNSVNFIFSAKIVSLFHRLPLGAGIARFVTDCAKPLVIFFFAFFAAFPLPEKNSVNFIFSAKIVSLFHRLPLGAGIARFVTDCAKPLVIFLLRLLHSLPPGGKVPSASEADEGQPDIDLLVVTR